MTRVNTQPVRSTKTKTRSVGKWQICSTDGNCWVPIINLIIRTNLATTKTHYFGRWLYTFLCYRIASVMLLKPSFFHQLSTSIGLFKTKSFVEWNYNCTYFYKPFSWLKYVLFNTLEQYQSHHEHTILNRKESSSINLVT